MGGVNRPSRGRGKKASGRALGTAIDGCASSKSTTAVMRFVLLFYQNGQTDTHKSHSVGEGVSCAAAKSATPPLPSLHPGRRGG